MLSIPTLLLIAATLVGSFVLAQALVLSAHRHGHLTMDHPGAVQKFHSSPTPRVGGIAIYLALVGAWIFMARRSEAGLMTTLLLAGMPALLVGLLEDVTKQVSVRTRLLLTMASGGFAALWTGIGLTRVGIPLADVMLSLWPVAVLFTAFAVGGVANSINIIDGFHGLASGTVIISSIALSAIALSVGDVPLASVALVLAAAVGGFWLVNFPWGKLFLGDGGAYFSGFALAWLSVELLARNPGVSSWASVLLCGYPTIEVVYSILRRRRQRRSPGDPDRHHLHSLVATQVVEPRLRELPANMRNAAVSVVMWMCAVVPVLPAIFFPRSPEILVPSLLLCAAGYHVFYRRVSAALAPKLAEGPLDVRA